MITAADIRRWVQEAAPGLRGGFVHRVWRDEADAWVLLVRQHEGGDPEARATARAALEVALPAEWARVVGVPPDAVAADDDKAKKAQARDPHPFLALLRRHLVGARVDDVVAVPGERIVYLDATHPTPSPSPDAQPRLRLIVELIARQGNLVLGARDEGGHVRCLGALAAGKAPRTFERGTLYQPPPPRPPKADGTTGVDDAPQLCPDVEPDPARLTLGRAVAAAQREKAEAAVSASRHATYLRAARQALKRADGVIHKLEAQLADIARADELERQADLLKANLGAIPRGAAEARLTDYATGEPVEVVVKLDPSEPVQDQMQALYKKARKLRAGEAAVQTRLGEVDANVATLQELAAAIEAADPDDEAALDDLERRLRKLGALPKESVLPRAKVQVNQGPRSFRTREGHEVLVGRNDEENDRLTMRMARGNDLFFHVRGMPGSHVILRVDQNRPPNHESLLDAATVAVHWSKARNRGTAVDVSYTPRKWVKKPRGAKPGLVQISNEKTIRAGNDPERLKRILATGRREDAEGDDA